MTFGEEALNRVEDGLQSRGIAVLEEIPLDPRFFRWQEPNRRLVTNVALRRSPHGTLLVYVDDDLACADDRLSRDILGPSGGNGWQQLMVPPRADVAATLAAVSEALGLDGVPPREPRGEPPAGEVADQAQNSDGGVLGAQAPREPHVVVAAEGRQRAHEERRFFASQFGKNLTELAVQGKLGPVVGRDEELRSVVEILCKKGKNAPLLIGEPGVGKSAIVEGLAQRIAEGAVPALLRGSELVEVNLGFLVAGASMQGEVENRVRRLLEEAQRHPDLVLFLDEIHMINAPAMGGTVANMLKGDLARGTFRVIAATTYRDYKQNIEPDGALARRFQNVLVKEPTEEQSLRVLQELRPGLEAHHGVRVPDEVLKAAVSLAARYVGDRQLPDKAIDLLDEVCARTALQVPAADACGPASGEGVPSGDVGNGGSDAGPDSSAPPDLDAAIEEAIHAGDYARAKRLHDLRSRRG